ncbi:MAG: ClpXP protease specificity-enhancing factor SspB [Devosia sp.]
MAEDHMRYDILTQEALRGVVRKVLSEVAKTGLPGEHHFFISFVTRAPGVRLSEKLLGQYEKEMTIVIQNQYWDLKVSETGFEVGLSFDGIPETLVIPFSAVKGFFDPSVQFGMQFDPATAPGAAAVEAGADASLEAAAADDSAQDGADKPGEKVVSLDSFRKKP